MKNQEIAWLLREKYNGEKTAGFFTDCGRLAAGEPLAYLIGSIPFLDCHITLDSHPLIPRPETEYWVEKAINEIQKMTVQDEEGTEPVSLRILDLCAGSGAIGIAVAKAIPEAIVTLAEIDPAHLPTIEKNIQNNLADTANQPAHHIIVSDLFAHIDGTFDVILTNPPYIDKDAHTVDAEVVQHEPALALFGGQEGLTLIRRIIAEASRHLTPYGQLWIEHEPFQATAITQEAIRHGYTSHTHRDQYDTERYSILTNPVAQ